MFLSINAVLFIWFMMAHVNNSTLYISNKTIIGWDNVLHGSNLRVIGSRNAVHGSNAIVEGDDNVIRGSNAKVTGHRNRVHGSNGRAVGNKNMLHGTNCFAQGKENEVVGVNASAKGARNSVRDTGKRKRDTRGGDLCNLHNVTIDEPFKFRRGARNVSQFIVRSGDTCNVSNSVIDRSVRVSGDEKELEPPSDAKDKEREPDSPTAAIPPDVPDEECEDEARACKVCLSRVQKVVCAPCGHVCLCRTCMYALPKLECPICQKRIDKFYMAYIT